MNNLITGLLIWFFIGIMGVYLTKDMPEPKGYYWEESIQCYRC